MAIGIQWAKTEIERVHMYNAVENHCFKALSSSIMSVSSYSNLFLKWRKIQLQKLENSRKLITMHNALRLNVIPTHSTSQERKNADGFHTQKIYFILRFRG